MYKIISISGKAKHGKTSTSEILKRLLEKDGQRVCIINYADLLKFYAKTYFSWDGLKNNSGRTLLQLLGTERVRIHRPDYWVDHVINFAKLFSNDFDYFIISDTRFPNELNKWGEEGINIIKLWVTRLDYDNGLSEEQKNHLSETSLDDYRDNHGFDYYITSKSGLDNLEFEVRPLYDIIK